MRCWHVWPLVVLLAVVACDDGPATPPDHEGVPEADLVFVEFADSLLPLAETEGSCWVVKEERDCDLVLRYRPQDAGDAEGEEFLEFKVAGNALLRRPDGTPFARGDSVRITVVVDDAGRFLFDFSPSGLTFDPDRPAELEVTYLRADDDLNGDGSRDGEDEEVERSLSIWKQERPGEPWFEVASLHFEDLEELEADVTGFSRFALAGN